MAKAEEFRNEITSKIIAALENGTAPWQQPWRGTEAPYNAITQHQYNGINSVILSLAAMSMNVARTDSPQNSSKSDGFDRNNNTVGTDSIADIDSTESTENVERTDRTDRTDNAVRASQRADQRWATYLQISNAGWHVRKGEKGTHVLLWKPNINTKEDGGTEITSVTQRIFTVFHASQIEGIPAYVPPEVNIIAAHEKAEKIILSSGVRILFGGSQAFYSPSGDYIQVPHRGDFKSREAFYSTVLHELIHATAHKTRLNREQRCGKFSLDYAFEELVAEMGSLFIASSAGIPQSECEFQNHASYIESWLKSLRNDNMYIFRAAAEASKAAAYLLKNAGQLESNVEGQAGSRAEGQADNQDSREAGE